MYPTQYTAFFQVPEVTTNCFFSNHKFICQFRHADTLLMTQNSLYFVESWLIVHAYPFE
ncbi:Uncharacterised protein [Klebsiella oxytoca]|nr:Uncharacterised protein [Klebsiella oxytoca]